MFSILQVDQWTEKYRKKGLEFKDLLTVYNICEQQVHRHTEEEVRLWGELHQEDCTYIYQDLDPERLWSLL